MNNASEYASLSLNQRVHAALELGEKVSMDHHHYRAMVSTIVEQLTSAGHSAGAQVDVLKLVKELLDQMSDMRDHCNLMDCLDSMRASTAH